MPEYSAHKTRLFVGGLNVSTTSKSLSNVNTRNMLPVTAHADASRVFLPGLMSHNLTMGLMFDSDTVASNAQWTEMTGYHNNGTTVPFSVYPPGDTVSDNFKNCWMGEANQQNWEIKSDQDGLVEVDAEFGLTGPILFGQSVASAASAVTASGNGTVSNQTAQTLNGGHAHMHVTAVSGTSPTLDVVIEMSADGATSWSTIATFAQATTTGSQRVTVATGTTVRRYLRAVYTVGGTAPSFNVNIAFART